MPGKLGDILLRLGYVTETDIEKALVIQRASGGERKIGEILSDFILKKEELLHALSMQEGGYEIDESLDIVSKVLRHRLQHSDIKHLLGTLSSRDHTEFMGAVANILEKVAAFIDVSNRLCDTLSLDVLLRQIIEVTNEAMNADRSTLFLNDAETGELYSRVAEGQLKDEIRIPASSGIAGAVFTGGKPIIIDDAYSDPRFNKDVDRATGFKTNNILSAPIKTKDNKTVGVIQVLNKREGRFTADDLLILEAITSQASAALQNAQLFEQILKAREEETRLLEVTTAISSELNLQPLLIKIMDTTTDILDTDRSTLFMYDEKTDELWSLIAQGAESRQIRFPSSTGIAGTVFKTGQTINIADAYEDNRFNPEVDRKTGYRTKSILCMPVINKAGKIIGVIQVLNKKGGPFTGIDEKRMRAFSAQASIALENAKLFDDVLNMKNYNESMLESMGNGVITLDAETHMVKCNTASLRILDAKPEDIVGLRVSVYFSGKNSWVAERILHVLETRLPDITMDTELLLPGGKTVSINLTIVPLINVKNEQIGSMMVFEDITTEKRVKSTMARYMTKEVADKLLEGGDSALGGQIQEATVLFSDIRSFTTISEKLGAQQTVSMLNEYFTVMVDIIFRYRGILDKYIGDAILSVFGTPFSSGEDEDNAVRASIDMMAALEEFNGKRANEKLQPIRIGIGINTAEILAGNIGSPKRMDYTVIGDGVNLASRLEGANKFYGTGILISEFTYRKLKRRYLTRSIDRIRAKGKTEPVEIYEILGHEEGPQLPEVASLLELYGRGIDYYRQRRWKEGAEAFERAVSLRPGDGPSRIYLERCMHCQSCDPGEQWDGIWQMETK